MREPGANDELLSLIIVSIDKGFNSLSWSKKWSSDTMRKSPFALSLWKHFQSRNKIIYELKSSLMSSLTALKIVANFWSPAHSILMIDEDNNIYEQRRQR